jgi:hypothetical protein
VLIGESGMIELGIGIFCAASFVTAYLVAAKCCTTGAGKYMLRRCLTTSMSPRAVRSNDARNAKKFLTADELSEHHSGGSSSASLTGARQAD